VEDSISSTAPEEEEDKPKLKATGHVFQVPAAARKREAGFTWEILE